MSRVVRAYEMVRLKPKGPFPNSLRWKVTARYSVQVGPDKTLACVRVRAPGSLVLHFSEAEFLRLFSPEGKRP